MRFIFARRPISYLLLRNWWGLRHGRQWIYSQKGWIYLFDLGCISIGIASNNYTPFCKSKSKLKKEVWDLFSKYTRLNGGMTESQESTNLAPMDKGKRIIGFSVECGEADMKP